MTGFSSGKSQRLVLPEFRAEICRWAGLAVIGHIVYFLHLVSIMMLFLYMPYTKFAHLAFRTFAMAFEKYRESAFAQPVVK